MPKWHDSIGRLKRSPPEAVTIRRGRRWRDSENETRGHGTGLQGPARGSRQGVDGVSKSATLGVPSR